MNDNAYENKLSRLFLDVYTSSTSSFQMNKLDFRTTTTTRARTVGFVCRATNEWNESSLRTLV